MPFILVKKMHEKMTALLHHKVRLQNETLFDCWFCQRPQLAETSDLIKKKLNVLRADL